LTSPFFDAIISFERAENRPRLRKQAYKRDCSCRPCCHAECDSAVFVQLGQLVNRINPAGVEIEPMVETKEEHLERERREHDELAADLPDWLVYKPDGFSRVGRDAEHLFVRRALERMALIEKRHGRVHDVFFVGGGAGMEAEAFARAGYAVTISDLSANLLRCAQKRFETRGLEAKDFVVADAQNLPLGNDGCSVAVAYECLHHVPEPDLALAEMARVAARGIILVEPFTTALFGGLSRVNLAHRVEYSGLKPHRFKYDEIGATLHQVGFTGWSVHRYLRFPEDLLPKFALNNAVASVTNCACTNIARVLPVTGNVGIVTAWK
jgi:SAM-dependent methyltransferase